MAVVDAPDGAGWWGDGPSPTDRWPGVTISIGDLDGRYHFDAALADRVCDWFPRFCSHSKGQSAGQKFELLEYQRDLILRPLFGWVDASGARRFRKAYIEVPKKNGKTQLIAGLGLYMLLADREPGAEVYVAAADREQARILFEAAKAMVEANPYLSKRCVVYRNEIKRTDDPSAFFKVLSAEAATKHGPNIHCLIIDELHAQPDRELFETLTRGVIARRQPLILLITTAGDDDESICFEEYEYAKRVLSGTVVDRQHLPVIFEAKPDEDAFSPDTWRRVNPALGATIAESPFAAFATEARNEPRKLNDFLRYNLNRWVNQATAWIPVDWWDACDAPLPSLDELRRYPCAVGIDMAQKIDLAAAVIAFKLPLPDAQGQKVEVIGEEANGQIVKKTASLDYMVALVPAFWLPDDTIRERAKNDRVPYDLWAHEAFNGRMLLNAVDGAIVSSEPIVKYFTGHDGELSRFPKLKVAQFAYDPAFATEVALQLRDAHGLTVVEVLQNYKHLSEACQVFEALVKAKRIIHGGHRLLRWNVENVAIKTDDARRIRPVKPRSSTRRIDGVVASIMAISRLMALPVPKPKAGTAKVWTRDGFRPTAPAETQPHA